MIFLLSLGCGLALADTSTSGTLYREAVSAKQTGNLVVAEQKVGELVRHDNANPGYYSLLGDIYMTNGNLEDALHAFEKASALSGAPDAERAKKMATCSEWMREYSSAEGWLKEALLLHPDDAEASSSLENLQFRRSLHFLGSLGAPEPDYTRNAYEAGAFVGWVEWLDLYGGYSSTDRIFYRRTTSWLDAYVYPTYRSYLRLGWRGRSYRYPISINPDPDNNSFASDPGIQIEGGYVYGSDNSAALELEISRPNFYWNTAMRATVLKVGMNLKNVISGPFYAKLFGTLLRDPDPTSVSVDPMTNRLLSFGNESIGLLGGALGMDDGKFSMEVKYIPDRDLDRSLNWSVFGKIRYLAGQYGVQYDILYDTYLHDANRGFSASQVHMLTLIVDLAPVVELRGGAKALVKQGTDVAPFLSLRYKTGW